MRIENQNNENNPLLDGVKELVDSLSLNNIPVLDFNKFIDSLNFLNSNVLIHYNDTSEEFKLDEFKNLNIHDLIKKAKYIINSIAAKYTPEQLNNTTDEELKTNFEIAKAQLTLLVRSDSNKRTRDNSIVLAIKDYIRGIVRSKCSDVHSNEQLIDFLKEMEESNQILTFVIEKDNAVENGHRLLIKTSDTQQTLNEYLVINYKWFEQIKKEQDREQNLFKSFIHSGKEFKDFSIASRSSKFLNKNKKSEEDKMKLNSILNIMESNSEFSNLLSNIEKYSKYELLNYALRLKSENDKLTSQIEEYKVKLNELRSTLGSLTETCVPE